MAAPMHTYGPTCLLHEPEASPTVSSDSDTVIPDPPRIRAQFFYASPLPIDDPLTAIPAPSSSSSSQAKLLPRPFAVRDNIALEEAWLGLKSSAGEDGKKSRDGDGDPEPSGLSVQESGRSRKDNVDRNDRLRGSFEGSLDSYGESPRLQENTSRFSGSFRGDSQALPQRTRPFRDRSSLGESEDTNPRKRHSLPIERKSKVSKRNRASSPGAEDDGYSEGSGPSTPQVGRYSADMSISGSPFIRAPIRDRVDALSRSPISLAREHAAGSSSREDQPRKSPSSGAKAPQPESQPKDKSKLRPPSRSGEVEPGAAVTVGASRLHSVELPELQMKPIYWSPVQDIAPVIRATWFYKNTMLPIEPEVANQLEAGYMKLHPWTETWQDELNSCVENGAEAELKIVHKIWPNEESMAPSRSGSRLDSEAGASMSSGRSDRRQSASGIYENQAAGSTAPNAEEGAKMFKNSSVIYVDSKDAQILRPSLLPSVSSGRRPLSAIRKGRQIGIAVVRGFNRQVWDKLHPPKLISTNARNFMKMHQTAMREAASRRQICYACQMEDRVPGVSDLVLVIHGIGQKLSERVESFHFTHAINAFRRQVNIELSSDNVWPNMRPELENIMVLPVNWRSTLSLDDADVEAAIEEEPNANHFSLKDITPETIPAVRNLISDVMLDIPYYLSHHKQKMVRAVVKEANRIHRLWCKNNPGFQSNGRVHLLAHSLGTIMTIDVLSQQPTELPFIDFTKTEINENIFEFDTKNVFFCGSPAGFFLLLNKSTLIPRRNRRKTGWDDEEDNSGSIAGEAGTYGCLAVDNLYNVMHETDPIAYRLNAAVDSDLANSLKRPSVPTSSTSLLQSVSSVFRWSSQAQSTYLPAQPQQQHPTTAASRPSLVSKLPSNIEMETHDFTREEIAEKRMQFLNDNGQIDFYISGGGGPLNIQYLNMLSAHSSYWVLPDFVRFIVVEIGRRQGRKGTLMALRAEKKKGWKRK